jgi:hypothetical protein
MAEGMPLPSAMRTAAKATRLSGRFFSFGMTFGLTLFSSRAFETSHGFLERITHSVLMPSPMPASKIRLPSKSRPRGLSNPKRRQNFREHAGSCLQL